MGKKTKSKKVKAKERISSSSILAPGAQSSTKRQRDCDGDGLVKKVAGASGALGSDEKSGRGGSRDSSGGDGGDLVFEDPFGDDFDPEDIQALQSEEDDRGEIDYDENKRVAGRAPAVATSVEAAGAADMEIADGEAEEAEEKGRTTPQEKREVHTKVWRAGMDTLPEGEELECDSTAYHMYHSLRPEWPCLSFDVIRDGLGTNRSRFPHTMFAVVGTQADRADRNRLQVMKLSDLHRTSKAPSSDDDEDEDSEEEGPDETDDDPTLDHVNIPHKGGVNRVRSMPQRPHVVATWSETSGVYVWDLERQVSALAKGGPRTSKVDPAFTFGGHAEVSRDGCVFTCIFVKYTRVRDSVR